MQPGRTFTQGSSYRYGFNGQEKDKELNENVTSALYWEYDSRIDRRWNVDPITQPNESSYLVFSGNPINMNDILGNSGTSTHTDKNGKVIAVFDDKDLGIYRHEDNGDGKAPTLYQLTKRHEKSTSAGGVKMSETKYWDEFLNSHTRLPKDAGDQPYVIKFGEKWDEALKEHRDAAINTLKTKGPLFGSLALAGSSENNGTQVLQDQSATRAQGRLYSDGLYYSSESMGNFVAGSNAKLATIAIIGDKALITQYLAFFEGFQRLAGAYEVLTHRKPTDPPIPWGLADKIKIFTGYKTYGAAPLYGEYIQQYRMSAKGFEATTAKQSDLIGN